MLITGKMMSCMNKKVVIKYHHLNFGFPQKKSQKKLVKKALSCNTESGETEAKRRDENDGEEDKDDEENSFKWEAS